MLKYSLLRRQSFLLAQHRSISASVIHLKDTHPKESTYNLQKDFSKTAKKVSETAIHTMDAAKDKTYDMINKAKGGTSYESGDLL